MIEVIPHGNYVTIKRDEPLAAIVLSWPEANKLQADLRRACVQAGLTIRNHQRDALGPAES